MPAPALYAAAPTFRIDGEANRRLPGLLVTMVIDEDTDGLKRAEVAFHNVGGNGSGPDYLFFDRTELDFGNRIEIEAGAGDRAGSVFDGYVTGLRGEFPNDGVPRLTLLAEDRLQDLRMTRRTRTFEDVTDATIIEQIASDHGLQSAVDLSGPTHRVVAQLNQSDLAFVRDRARAAGGEVSVVGTRLVVANRSDRGGDPIVLSYRQNLSELTATADLAHQRTSVSVSGWDVAAKEAIDAEATDQSLSSELAGGASGSSVLEDAFGPRPDRIVRAAPTDTAAAQAIADAAFRDRARRFLTAEGTTEGDARIDVGASVEIAGAGPMFNGPYTVTASRHLFDVVLGFRTVFRIERPGLGR
jgi:phage protein D